MQFDGSPIVATMSSLGEAVKAKPAATKKKKASTKRKVLRAQDNVQVTASVYSVANIHQTFQSSVIGLGDSDDEEENCEYEQFQAKLNQRIRRGSGRSGGCKKQKTSCVDYISDEDDGHKTPEPTNDSFKVPSPSPPPPPPLEFQEPRNKRTEKTVKNLDKAYHNAVVMQRLRQSSTPSPMSDRSQVIDVDLDNSFELARSRQEITVKVRTKHGLKRYQMAMDEPLIKIIISLAEMGSVDVNTIQLTRNAEQLNEYDTPASLNLRVTDILDCVVIDPSNITQEDLSDLIPESDKVLIKFQGREKKSAFSFSIPKFDPLKRALEAYSEFLSTPLDKLKFMFDGEEVSPTDTPEQLDTDEQATIDVIKR